MEMEYKFLKCIFNKKKNNNNDKTKMSCLLNCIHLRKRKINTEDFLLLDMVFFFYKFIIIKKQTKENK